MAGAGLVAALVGTSLAQIGAQYATNIQNMRNQMAINKQNIGMQLAYNADQVAVAQMNNQTQIDMANTAHQREVKDLRDAGLNPILSATGGNGAAMPSLGNPDGGVANLRSYDAQSPLKELGTSAREIGRLISGEMQAEVDYQKAQAKMMEEYAKQATLDTYRTKWDNQLHNVKSRLEYDAYKQAEVFELDEEGRPVVVISADGTFPFDPEVVRDTYKGIKADIHNRKWSDIKGWIGSGGGAAADLSGSVLNGARMFKLLKGRK